MFLILIMMGFILFLDLFSAFLPKPPVRAHIVPGSVMWDSAEIAWEKPNNFTSEYYFTVAWKPDTEYFSDWKSVGTFNTF